MTKIAVFGGGGFIGSHLSRRLVKSHTIDIIDIDLQKISGLKHHENATLHKIDIRESSSDSQLQNIIRQSDIVIDLIAYANPQQYVDMPLEVVRLNYDMNLKLVESCAEANKRLIQFSTSEVYGKVGARTGNQIEFDEDTSDLVMGPVGNHRWIYATAKQLLERMVNAHGLKNNLSWTIVRPFNFIGPQMDYIVKSPEEGTPRVFASFMSALLNNHPMHLVDGGTNRRTFTHILDAVDAIEQIIDNEASFNTEVVNIGTPSNEVTISNLATIMRDLYSEMSPDGSLPELQNVDGIDFYGEGYEDIERRVPNISKLQSVGWVPEYDLEETLRDAITYYIDHYERPDVTAHPSFE